MPPKEVGPGTQSRATSTSRNATSILTDESGGLLGELTIAEPPDYVFTGAPVMTKDLARRMTNYIRLTTEALWDVVVTVYRGGAWKVLGYSSWDDYCTQEFGPTRLRLPREERAEVVASLRESGLSIRAIASATGTGTRQVQEALREQVCSQTTPAEPDEDALADELIVAEQELPPLLPENVPGAPTESTPGQTGRVVEALDRARRSEAKPAPIIGTDGKRYQPKPAPLQREPQKPRRRPLTQQADALSLELNRINRRLEKLVTDDRFSHNREMIGCRIRPAVKTGLDVLGRLDRGINGPKNSADDKLSALADVLQQCVVFAAGIDFSDVTSNAAPQHIAAVLDNLDGIHDILEQRGVR